MNLKLFFSPYAVPKTYPANSLGGNITSQTSDNFDIAKMDMAIVGITENRGTSAEGVNMAANKVREKLYALKRGSAGYRITDLGNLNNGPELEESQARLREVCEFLMAYNVIPLIIGGSQEMALGQYRAYESHDRLVSVMNVDAKLDMEEEGETSKAFLTGLLTHQPNYLFSYNHLAYQSYLVDAQALGAIDKLYFESKRLGELRDDIQEAEPLIRLADMLSFDVSAIRSADAPGAADPQAFGLTAEEACQITWYAGMNDKLSSISISEFSGTKDDDYGKTASVVATMVWYFIEGFYNRKDNGHFDSDNYLKYVVSMEGTDDTLEFYKSKLSDKWWMVVTYGQGHAERAFIPCSYNDYTGATHGDFPERWIQAQGKLV
ncbi:MAG: formimidoylglutamase [Roseivirga sp.]|nr:formimidoylglutamase [Roseivirga sp.]